MTKLLTLAAVAVLVTMLGTPITAKANDSSVSASSALSLPGGDAQARRHGHRRHHSRHHRHVR
jgi:hypothetical protein